MKEIAENKKRLQEFIDRIRDKVPSFVRAELKYYKFDNKYCLYKLNGVEFLSQEVGNNIEYLYSSLVEMDITEKEFLLIFNIFESLEFERFVERDKLKKNNTLKFKVSKKK